MARRMLIDATHSEETRVVVLNANKLEEFDFETSTKKQIKGNIYLAKVIKVEPSLQAAFVEYGGNRHGFLAFSEIHPDYYRIPVGDREALIAAERAAVRDDDAGDSGAGDEEPAPIYEQPDHDDQVASGENGDSADGEDAGESYHSGETSDFHDGSDPVSAAEPGEPSESTRATGEGLEPVALYASVEPVPDAYFAPVEEPAKEVPLETSESVEQTVFEPADTQISEADPASTETTEAEPTDLEPAAPLDTVGGDELEEMQARPRVRHYRNYKIQEVIKRRQILLIQVSKEERGNKGAALTTYLSLAGRYCVLMPNAGRGGGVSRKITSAADRRRLKELMDDLDVPEGMGVIVRTAGSERSKPEIKRDYEYLLRLWDDIRSLTLRSSAPALIYEEGNLIKRAIRDLYTRDIEEILVEGEDGYRAAKEFMRMLSPGSSARVIPYRDPGIPLFHRFQVDSQIDLIHNPVVQLRSGGYIVINPTEALVSIDVNSGRATRERNIEETATKTNLEAAEEVARQLRLRDLAGLVVIDFIDMEETRNQKAVEARLKDAMKNDRARIQLGRISPFGLLELSRQRLRSSVIEASTQICPHCNGSGTIRSTESTTLVVLRALEEEGIRRRTAEVTIHVPSQIAFYLLNQKRDSLIDIERRYGFRVTVEPDDTLIPPAYRLDRVRPMTPAEFAALPSPLAPVIVEEEDPPLEDDETPEAAEIEIVDGDEMQDAPETDASRAAAGDGDRPRRKRRRRKRRRPGEAGAPEFASAESGHDDTGHEEASEEGDPADEGGEGLTEDADGEEGSADREPAAAGETEAQAEAHRRRRGRRGGRRRRRDVEGTETIPVAGDDPVADFEPYASPYDFARDGRAHLFDEGVDVAPSAVVPTPVALSTDVFASEEFVSAPLVTSVAPSDIGEPVESGADAEAVEPAPKRRRTPRKKADVAGESAVQSPSEEPQTEKLARPRRSRRIAESDTIEIIAESPESEPPSIELEPLPIAQAPSEPEPELISEPEGEPRPRRTGWWKRLMPDS